MGQYEKRENRKIFKLQKKTVRIAYGNAGGVLEGEKRFLQSHFLPQTPFVKTYPQFSP
ncbi:MAG: hypothetical protein ACI920_003622 [Saprospiraceae bacterium]